ncbi:NAD(P)-dependent oxidoreductase [Streptomyces xinghaiensis]|uniref:NAD(P)-dependent oxidoreductase n=1 Tax=Streptomyces xinghaiensis TaxID=1038928 RepID=UPI003426E25C
MTGHGLGTTVGILHPGSMGAAVGGQLRGQGICVLWLPEGRSRTTVERAEAAGMEAVDGLPRLLERADVVLSLCPPAAAEDVARQVAAHGFPGKTYVEGNAVAPARMRRICELLPDATVVDGAVIGSPPLGGKQPRLYLAGRSSALALLGDLFALTDVRVHPLGEELGRASALKLAYSSYQKASRVLAAVAFGLARANGVGDELLDVARLRPGSYLPETGYIPKSAARAWRWGPELEEAAALLHEAGLPDELMRASAAVLTRWNTARGSEPSIEEALSLLMDDR